MAFLHMAIFYKKYISWFKKVFFQTLKVALSNGFIEQKVHFSVGICKREISEESVLPQKQPLHIFLYIQIQIASTLS